MPRHLRVLTQCRDVPPVNAAAVDAVCVPDTHIGAVSVSPNCSVVAVQHAHDVVCYSTAALMDQRKTEPLWTWRLQGGASVRQARHGRAQHMSFSDAHEHVWRNSWRWV